MLLCLQALPQPGVLLRGKAVPDTSINTIDQVSKVRHALCPGTCSQAAQVRAGSDDTGCLCIATAAWVLAGSYSSCAVQSGRPCQLWGLAAVRMLHSTIPRTAVGAVTSTRPGAYHSSTLLLCQICVRCYYCPCRAFAPGHCRSQAVLLCCSCSQLLLCLLLMPFW